LTLFVGGNHEASNYLRELHYGGWAAPNIYFMGMSSVVKVTKTVEGEKPITLKIGGISGIEKYHDYRRGYYEPYPFDGSSYSAVKSMYHIREFDVEKLKMYPSNSIDIFVSHEWPTVATQHNQICP
jgi:lariat debranching enzyme